MISRFSEYYRLTDYLARFTKKSMGFVMSVNNLLELFEEKYYKSLGGGILEAFGRIFTKDLNLYLYPFKNEKTGELMHSGNLKVKPKFKELYKHFKKNGRILDVNNYNPSLLEIYSKEILKKIQEGKGEWENDLPDGVAQTIKDNSLFGHASVMY